MPRTILIYTLISLTLVSIQASANSGQQYAFVQLGKLKFNDSESTISADGEELTGEYDDLPFFAGGIQTVLGGETFRYGYEGGAIISWQNDSVSYYGTSGGDGTEITVQIDNELFLFGTMLGAFGDINFNDYARFYISTGPMLFIASIDQQSDDEEVQPTSTVTINGRERELGSGYGWYGAAGIIISPDKHTEFGLVIREQNVNLNFSNKIADVSYDGRQIMFSIGYKI